MANRLEPYTIVRDYYTAKRFLGKKVDRPLSRTHIRCVLEQDYIGIRLYSTDVVRYYPNGDFSLHTDGWNTQTTRRTQQEYTQLSVFRHKGIAYIPAEGFTEPKIQKCRSCRGRNLGWKELQDSALLALSGIHVYNWHSCSSRFANNTPCGHAEKSDFHIRDCTNCKNTSWKDVGSKPAKAEILEGMRFNRHREPVETG